jgi:Na+-driven multidrug efflux pump
VFGKFGLPRLGVLGAAIGTVIGLILNLVIYVYAFTNYKNFKIRLMISPLYLSKIMKSFVPLLGQDFIESTGFSLILTMILTRLEPSLIATYAVLKVIVEILTLPIYAYSSACLTLTAKAQGSKQYLLVKQIPLLVIRQLLKLLVLLILLVIIFKHVLPTMITSNSVLLALSVKMIPLAACIQLLNMLNQVCRFALNSLGDENWVMYFSLAVNIASLVVIYLLIIPFTLGLYGLFIGLAFSYALHATGFYLRFKTIHCD